MNDDETIGVCCRCYWPMGDLISASIIRRLPMADGHSIFSWKFIYLVLFVLQLFFDHVFVIVLSRYLCLGISIIFASVPGHACYIPSPLD